MRGRMDGKKRDREGRMDRQVEGKRKRRERGKRDMKGSDKRKPRRKGQGKKRRENDQASRPASVSHAPFPSYHSRTSGRSENPPGRNWNFRTDSL